MTFDYDELEIKLETACQEIHDSFTHRFKSGMYLSIGGAILESFISELQGEFENAAITFLKENNLEKDAHAKKRALTITKLYAKRCIDDFGKIDKDIAAE